MHILPCRVSLHFDGRVKRVHVDVQNHAHGDLRGVHKIMKINRSKWFLLNRYQIDMVKQNNDHKKQNQVGNLFGESKSEHRQIADARTIYSQTTVKSKAYHRSTMRITPIDSNGPSSYGTGLSVEQFPTVDHGESMHSMQNLCYSVYSAFERLLFWRHAPIYAFMIVNNLLYCLIEPSRINGSNI